jgi:hypothetical protein
MLTHVILTILALLPETVRTLEASQTGALQQTLQTHPDATVRLGALRSLQKAGELDGKQIARSLADTSAVIRAEVIHLSASLAFGDEELRRKILALCNDKSGEVRLAVLRNLSRWEAPRTAKPLIRILAAQTRSPKDWQAAMEILGERLPTTLRMVMSDAGFSMVSKGEASEILKGFGNYLASRSEWIAETLDLVHQKSGAPLWQRMALLQGLIAPASGYPSMSQNPAALSALINCPEPALASLARELDRKLNRQNGKN